MKAVHATLALSIVLSTSVFAQETAPAPAPAPEPVAADPALKLSLPGSPPSAPANDNLGLIPETPEPVTKPKGTAIPESKVSRKATDSPARTSASEDEMAARIRLRQLKTRILREPKTQALLEKARTAPTDYEKRETMKEYYTFLYSRIDKLDGSLKKRTKVLKNQAIHRLSQTKIDPTDPIDPSERSDATRWD
jgi:hypothetical protein